MKTLFKIKSKSNLVSFLNRFASVDKSMVLEIGHGNIMCKSVSEDKCVLKTSKMPLTDVLDGQVDEPIRLHIYEIKRVTGVFRHFKPTDEIALEIEHESVQGVEMAISMTFKTKSTKIRVDCGDMTLFRYTADEMLKKIVKRAVDSKKIEFPFTKDAYASVLGLSGLDDAKDPIKINVSNGEIMMRGKSYEQLVGDAPAGNEINFTMLNEHFGMIEPETSTIMLCQDSMLVKSQESSTIVIIGMSSEA